MSTEIRVFMEGQWAGLFPLRKSSRTRGQTWTPTSRADGGEGTVLEVKSTDLRFGKEKKEKREKKEVNGKILSLLFGPEKPLRVGR